MTTDADPGSIGPFLVRRKLGEGGMGMVYEGFDVALDRKVALKLIRRAMLGNNEIRARMLREAQAMAKVSHPNVVQVYQVGEHGDEIYVAMEYVEGQTLGAWLAAAKRPWRDVMRILIDAGRGLAAAHAADLVHRDFKPDNVLVGKDGRPRVLDFGLVHSIRTGEVLSAAPNSPSEPTSLARMTTQLADGETGPDESFDPERLTRTGRLLGTPAYMSPEQHFADHGVGAASDQFSFSVTLYEALYGVRPFVGATLAELRRAVRSGVVPPPPRDAVVPRRIFKILARGLAPTPGQRWPRLADMLDMLGRDPRRRALQIVGVAALASAVGLTGYMIAARRDSLVMCKAATQELAGVWDEARAGAVERAFMASGSALAADTWQRVRERLDVYANEWIDRRTQACATHADGSLSARMFDLRTACLTRRRAHLSALVDVFVAADRSVIENAVQATATLPSLDECADADALLVASALPDDSQTAMDIEAQRGRLARAAVLEATGQYTPGLQLASEVRAAAAGLGYPPLTAEAALVESRLLMALARHGEAESALTFALKLGIVHGLDTVAAEAAARRIFVLGEGQGRHAAALDSQPFAEALAERVRDDGQLAGLLQNNLGAVNDLAGAHEQAYAHYRRALELLGRRAVVADPVLPVVHHNLANLHLVRGRLDQARHHFTRSLELSTAMLGDPHPLTAHPLAGLAQLDLLDGDPGASAGRYLRALATMEAAYGPDHVYLLEVLVGLGGATAAMGDRATAAKHFSRAMAIGEHTGNLQAPADALYVHAVAGAVEQAVARDLGAARELLHRTASVHASLLGRRAPTSAPPERAVLREWFAQILADTSDLTGVERARALTALELAKLLAAAGERERACELTADARLGDGDPWAEELDVVRKTACARP